jgi:Zn-dependent M28 family amino/carboxypeptidase
VPNSLATFVINEDALSGTIEQQAARLSGFLDKGTMRLVSSTRGGRPRPSAGPLALLVSTQLADELLKPAGLTVAQLKLQAGSWTKAIPTGSSATIDLKVSREVKQSENVLGLLEGSDPKLKEEVVVFSAHYDHIGIGPDGAIFHGADDDGSGTSAILELAEAYVTNPVKPKRSLLFLAFSGEEKGLLGSEYYVSNPAIPLQKTIANLNIDMVGRVDKKYEAMKTDNYVYVIGSDKISTQLDSVLKVANKESENLTLDYQFNDDNDPNQFYRRSDHYNFARNSIPIIFFFTGIHDDYHRPTDTVDKILFDRMARIGRLVYTVGWKTANMPRPFVKDGKSSVYQ